MADGMGENQGPRVAPGALEAAPEVFFVSRQGPRISGTALVGGLHLATGNYGTAPWWRLTVSGAMIVVTLAIGLVLTYAELWLLDRFTGASFSATLLGFPGAGLSGWEAYAAVGLQLLPMLNFLVVLRLSPLSGYHAAEHKVVAAIEAYGQLEYNQVVEMPRAHPRCGTVLLFGILPTMLIAYPLFFSQPFAAVLIAVIGWSLRFHVGYFIQQYFTTKPPTPAQLEAGMRAGSKLMGLWLAEPDRRVSIARNIWTRGLPQMLIGVVIGQYLLGLIYQNMHVWLDF